MTNAAIIALSPDTAHVATWHCNGRYAPIDRVEAEMVLCLDGYAGGYDRARIILPHLIRLGGNFTLIRCAEVVLG